MASTEAAGGTWGDTEGSWGAHTGPPVVAGLGPPSLVSWVYMSDKWHLKCQPLKDVTSLGREHKCREGGSAPSGLPHTRLHTRSLIPGLTLGFVLGPRPPAAALRPALSLHRRC